MSEAGPILVFDSGIGGLSVLAAARQRLPDVRFIYVADDAGGRIWRILYAGSDTAGGGRVAGDSAEGNKKP